MLMLSTILKELLAKIEISESALARQTGVAQPIIHRILNSQNTNPKLETLKAIASYFRIAVSQLIGEIPLTTETGDSTKYGFSTVPLVNWKDATLWPNNIDIYKKNSRKILTTFRVSKLAYCLKVKNSSMEPVFPRNSLLVIEPDKAPKDKNYIVVKLGSHKEVVIKQILMAGERDYLKPLNPDLKDIPLIVLTKKDIYKGTVVRSIVDY